MDSGIEERIEGWSKFGICMAGYWFPTMHIIFSLN